MSDLTLPGTIPGLLRRGSPVIADSVAAGVYAQHALVVGADIDSDAVKVALLNDERFVWLTPPGLALDLTDRTGIAHAGWWLDSHHPRWADQVFFARLRGWIIGEGDAEALRDHVLRVDAAIRGVAS